MTREMLFSLMIGYAFGSVPFGLILTKLTGAGDLRSIGSGSIGATNVLRTGRKGVAAATAILDIAKGWAPVVLTEWLFPTNGIFAAAGALIGHCYPVWLRFRGGKGVATLMGIVLALLPIAAAIYAAIWILLLLTIRISSVAGMIAALSAPIVALILHSPLFPMLLGFALLVLWKHRENLLRLRRGTEPRIGSAST